MTGVLCQSNLIMIAVMAVKQLSGIWDPSLFVSIQSNSVLHTSTHRYTYINRKKNTKIYCFLIKY